MDGVSRASLRTALGQVEERFTADPTVARRISDGLAAVAGVLDDQLSLRRALTDPSSVSAGRLGLVDALFGAQLDAPALAVLRDLVALSWSLPADLREAVDVISATAALAAAEGEGALDDVEDELFRFARLLEREPTLRAALTDPALPAERKAALLQDLLGERARPATVRLVTDAVNRPRSRSLEAALDNLSRLAAQRRQRLVAAVTVARSLDATQSARLSAVLQRLYGREVTLQVDVDPAVLGGVEVRVGDEILDGTTRRRLATARRRLAG